MKGLPVIHRNPPASLARMAGMSLIELMIAIALGLIVLAGLATLFANQSAARSEMERSSRQIENGRFAMELLGDELRVAGYYGELNLRAITPPLAPAAALIDPCSFTPTDWVGAIPHHIQGYDNGAGAPGCLPADLRPNTDILVVRRVSTCVAGTANCAPAANGAPYIQVARCNAQMIPTPSLGNAFEFGVRGTEPFARTGRLCAAAAGLRQYLVRIYYVADIPAVVAPGGDPVPDPVPVLKRLDLNTATGTWDQSVLADGIEQLQLEYGIDTDLNGDPDVYTANPTTYACGGCTAGSNWANTVTVRIHVLARNVEPSVNYVDPKTYTLGRDAAGLALTVTPAGTLTGYRRHAYSGLVRLVNPSDRRDTP